MMIVGVFLSVVSTSFFVYGAESIPTSLIPTYLPSPKPSSSPSPSTPNSHGTAPIECFKSAHRFGLTFRQGILLCTNARSNDPIQCFNESSLLTVDQRINLCQGASSKASSFCFDETFDLLLTLDQRAKLCNGAKFRNTDSERNPYVTVLNCL